MNYGDFSSLVQLGVGLHLGAALLQMYGELGVAPLARTLGRVRGLFSAPESERPPLDIQVELERIESRFEIFRIQLFQEYRKYVIINSVNAGMLSIILVFLSVYYQSEINDKQDWILVVLVFMSIMPAPISLGILWFDASRLVGPMKREADDLERKAISSI